MRKAKASQGYTQRSFFSRGKAWSGDARRPFVSCASRTRNALASHGHRSRLPLTSRGVVPVCSTLYAAHPPTYTYTVPLHPSRPIPHNIPPSPSVPSLEEQPGAFARYALGPGNRIRGIYIAILAKTTRFSQPGKSRRREGSVDPFDEFEINIG